MPKNIESVFFDEVNIGFFKCIAIDCLGQGFYIIRNKEDNIRQCEECFHNMELKEMRRYIQKDNLPQYSKKP